MTMSTGYSKRSNFWARAKPTDMTMATPEPISTSTFISRAKGSTTKAPLKVTTICRHEHDREPADDQQHDRQDGHQGDDALPAAEDADHQQGQRADRQDDLPAEPAEARIRSASPPPLLRHGGELAGRRQRRLIVA